MKEGKDTEESEGLESTTGTVHQGGSNKYTCTYQTSALCNNPTTPAHSCVNVNTLYRTGGTALASPAKAGPSFETEAIIF